MTADLLLDLDLLAPIEAGQVPDRSRHGRHGVIYGDPIWAAGRGLYLDGRDDWIEVPGEGLHGETALTLIGDFVPLSFGRPLGSSDWHALLWKGDAPDCTADCENREFSLWLSAARHLHFTSTPKDRVGIGQLTLNSQAGSVAGRTAFAAVLDGEEMRLYQNGLLVARGPYSRAGIRSTSGPLTIGAAPANAQVYGTAMLLRGLRIYAGALSADEIRAAQDDLARAARREGSLPPSFSYPDDVILQGPSAQVLPLEGIARGLPQSTLEPGADLANGMLVLPENGSPTTAIFWHDGSAGTLTGQITLLDCLEWCGTQGTAEFAILGDRGATLWHSGVIRQTDPPRPFTVPLAGVRELRLVASDAGDGNREDWGAFYNLALDRAPVARLEAAAPPAAVGPAELGAGAGPTAPEPPPEQAGRSRDGVRVEIATLGANCGALRGNVTWPVARACDGRLRCDYALDPQVLSDLTPGCAVDLLVEWRCGNRGGAAQTARLEQVGPDSLVSLSCASADPGQPTEPPGQTSAPTAAALPAIPPPACDQVPPDGVPSDVGRRALRHCPPGWTLGMAWGTDVYTWDSDPCTAAAHAGLIEVGEGSVITSESRPGRTCYEASTRHGVSTHPFGPYLGSQVVISAAAAEVWHCPPGFGGGAVWGTDVYTSDSSVCTAAVHAGVITQEAGGTVFTEALPGQPSYEGSTRNGVTSASWGSYGGSFAFVTSGGSDPAAVPDAQ